MGTCAQMRALRDRCPCPDGYPAEIIYEGVLADARPFPNFQVPRHVDYRGIVDVHVISDLGAEQSQQQAAPPETDAGTEAEQRPAKPPQNAQQLFPAGIFHRASVGGDVQLKFSHQCNLTESGGRPPSTAHW